MRWSFKWRKQLKSGIYFDLLRRGFIKPDDGEPNVEGLEFYLEAFSELGSSRSIGMTIGPISFTAIVEYFRIYELSDFDEFAYIMRRLDNTFLELNAESSSGAEAGGGSTSASDNGNKKDSNQSGRSRGKGSP